MELDTRLSETRIRSQRREAHMKAAFETP